MDRKQAYGGPQVVGMDLHARRSVLLRMTPEGQRLGRVRIDNSPAALKAEMAKAGPHPKVVLEATYGWYWAADALAEAGAEVHLAHPLGVKMFTYRRVKTDDKDAADLADLLRMGRLPEAWIAPPRVREIRELVRYRQKLVNARTSAKTQVHAVLAKVCLHVPVTDLFGRAGGDWLAGLSLHGPYRARVASLMRLITFLNGEISDIEKLTAQSLAGDPGYRAVQTIPGVGPIFAAVMVAEIGDVTRFASPGQLCSWAGLTPRHRASDTKIHRGPITKQGSPLLRWACVEAVQRCSADTPMRRLKDRITQRRGSGARNTAKTAAARKLLTLVFYALRDGEVRCLAKTATA
ncbi:MULTISPECIES: IS110 family transposase [unclassified Streptomyces]|uniref:IS110 family transposase n=1 Tax=unclassified Streptomyces TaxID=2593676 RepID=UPI003D8BC896